MQASHTVAGFMRLLRREGYSAGVRETLSALSVIELSDPPEVGTLRAALRALTCRDAEQWRRFPALFDRYWLGVEAEEPPRAAARMDPRLRRAPAAATGLAHAVFEGYDATDLPTGSAGRQKTLTRTDFRFITEAQGRRQIEQLAERLALRLRKRLVRRRRVAPRGRRLHLRRTLRKSLALGGLPLRPRYWVRRREPPPLVLIQDISHSMAPYTPLLTRFVRGLLRVFRDAEAFVFHTELYAVSGLYRESDTTALRQRLEKMSHLWMGGTRIAESLARFNREHARRSVDARTLVVILSDGFDTDEPQRLAAELALLRSRCGRLIWLNPALTAEDLAHGEPFPAALLAVLDRLLPVGSLEALTEAVDAMLKPYCDESFRVGRVGT